MWRRAAVKSWNTHPVAWIRSADLAWRRDVGLFDFVMEKDLQLVDCHTFAERAAKQLARPSEHRGKTQRKPRSPHQFPAVSIA
jgi:hypothetical protein